MTDERNKRYIFPIVKSIENPDKIIARIYPLKQKQVQDIINEFRNDARIAGIYIFGSSTNLRCNRYSDLDVCVDLVDCSMEAKGEISEKIGIICDWNNDTVWLNNLSKESRLRKDCLNGVKIL